MSDVLEVFKALSDETRLKILKLLEHGELCVCHIVAAFDVGQSKISFHLNILKAAGLVKDRREGRWMYYRIDDSDLFRRFIVLSALDRIPRKAVAVDQERLGRFLREREGAVPKVKQCCAR